MQVSLRELIMKKILTVLFILLISQVAFSQTKFDEYGYLIPDNEGARLYDVFQEFSENKDSKIYILINKEKKMAFGKFLRYFYGVKAFLSNFNITKESIKMIMGEEKDKQLTQIYFVKNNNPSLVFKEVSVENKLQEKITKKSLFDTNCTDCDESPFIKQFIFREGLDYLAIALKANPTSNALLEVGRVEYLSRTVKERKELTKQIFGRLKKNGIGKERVSIQFNSGNIASFYIIPKKVRIKKT